MNALLGKAECFCDCSITFILFSPLPPSSFLFFYYLCVSVRLCGGERLTDTALVAIFMVHYNKSL